MRSPTPKTIFAFKPTCFSLGRLPNNNFYINEFAWTPQESRNELPRPQKYVYIHTHIFWAPHSIFFRGVFFLGQLFQWFHVFLIFCSLLSLRSCHLLCSSFHLFITDWQRACAPVREARSLPAKSWWLRRLMTATQDATGLHRCRNFGFDSRNTTLYTLYIFFILQNQILKNTIPPNTTSCYAY